MYLLPLVMLSRQLWLSKSSLPWDRWAEGPALQRAGDFSVTQLTFFPCAVNLIWGKKKPTQLSVLFSPDVSLDLTSFTESQNPEHTCIQGHCIAEPLQYGLLLT